MKRRGFLKFLSVSPVAAPVAAKEAAYAMGLNGSIGGLGEHGMAPVGGQIYDGPVSSKSWIIDQVKSLFSEEERENRRLAALDYGRRLDPDLASMRSVSPAFAYRAQVARSERRIEARQKSWLRLQAKKAGMPWIWGD